MLSNEERATFDQIVANLGRMKDDARRYLMPWWLPPAVLAFYGVLLTAISLTIGSVLAGVASYVLLVGAAWWAIYRRSHSSGSPVDLTSTPPWIE